MAVTRQPQSTHAAGLLVGKPKRPSADPQEQVSLCKGLERVREGLNGAGVGGTRGVMGEMG